MYIRCSGKKSRCQEGAGVLACNSAFRAGPLHLIWQTFFIIFMFCLYQSRTSSPSQDLALRNWDLGYLGCFFPIYSV